MKKKLIPRILKMLFKFYPVLAPITAVCIVFSALVSAIPALFVQSVIEVIEKWSESGDVAAASAVAFWELRR